MPESTKERKTQSKPQRQQEPKQCDSIINRTSLFVTILLISVGINCWLQLSRNSTENSPQSVQKDIEWIKSQLSSIVDKSNNVESKESESRSKFSDSKLYEMFAIKSIIQRAVQSQPNILFASNETKALVLTKVAQLVLKQTIHTCLQSITEKFDPYRNCFRDMSIEFHNRLTLIYPSHWYTTVGRVHYSFLITTMQSKRNEYLFTIGDVYFQCLEYPQLVTIPLENESNEDEPSDDSDISENSTAKPDIPAIDRNNTAGDKK